MLVVMLGGARGRSFRRPMAGHDRLNSGSHASRKYTGRRRAAQVTE